MKPRILVVDDDRAMVRTLCDILRLRGWDPQPAYSGEEAVDAQREHGFDHILMDIKMPGIDGITAFRRIKSISPDSRVILMTAHASADELAAAVKAGVAKVLPKPIDLPALFSTLSPA